MVSPIASGSPNENWREAARYAYTNVASAAISVVIPFRSWRSSQ